MKTNHTPQALKEVVEFVEEIIFTITSAQNTYKYHYKIVFLYAHYFFPVLWKYTNLLVYIV